MWHRVLAGCLGCVPLVSVRARARALLLCPTQPHQTLGSRRHGRVIVVGDVHGCLDELRALLAACGHDADADAVVLVGDLVNKGPKSAEVVRYAREASFRAVRGNHDEAAIDAWAKRQEAFATGRDPPDATTKYAYMDALSSEDVEYLRALPYTLALPRDLCGRPTRVVHAGLVPGVALERQDARMMTRMRHVVRGEDGGWEPVEKAVGDGTPTPWASEWTGPERLIFGHDAVRGLQQYPHALGLDTGCVYGGRLTAVVLPGDELVSVAAAREYAVPANRRNDAPPPDAAGRERGESVEGTTPQRGSRDQTSDRHGEAASINPRTMTTMQLRRALSERGMRVEQPLPPRAELEAMLVGALRSQQLSIDS